MYESGPDDLSSQKLFLLRNLWLDFKNFAKKNAHQNLLLPKVHLWQTYSQTSFILIQKWALLTNFWQTEFQTNMHQPHFSSLRSGETSFWTPHLSLLVEKCLSLLVEKYLSLLVEKYLSLLVEKYLSLLVEKWWNVSLNRGDKVSQICISSKSKQIQQ